MAIKTIPRDKSYNFKEVVLTGVDAITESIYQLLTTPIGMLPLFPTEGFDINELRGLEEYSDNWYKLKEELEYKIRNVVGNDGSIDVAIKRDGAVIDIVISFIIDGKIKTLPFRQADYNKPVELLFENILLK